MNPLSLFTLMLRMLLIACVAVFPITTSAEQQTLADIIKRDAASMNKIERALKRATVFEAELRTWDEQIIEIKNDASRCITETESRLNVIDEQLTDLGKKAKGEPWEVTKKRNSIITDKKESEGQMASCRVHLLRSDELLAQIAEQKKKLVARRLLTRGPTLTALLLEGGWQQLVDLLATTTSFLLKHSGAEKLTFKNTVVLIVLLLLAISAGIFIRQKICLWVKSKKWASEFSSCFARAAIISYITYAPHIVAGIAAALSFSIMLTGDKYVPFISSIAIGFPIVFFLVATINLFLSPPASADLCFKLPKDAAASLSKRLKLFVFLVFLGYLIFSTLLEQSLPESMLLLVRAIFTTVFILNLVWVVWVIGDFPYFSRTRTPRFSLQLVLLSVLVSEWLGYRNLSVAILRTVIGTLVVLGLALLFNRLLHEVIKGLDRGRLSWHRKFRKLLGLKAGDSLPGCLWLHFFASIAVWGTFAWLSLHIWGLSERVFQDIKLYVLDGFMIGSLKIVPARILLALVTFGVIISLSGWFKTRLEHRWLAKTRLDRGVREAIVTMSGYIGVTIAIFVMLGVAGLQFTNLAIIAGALSVGIGFGLQNIVNNFVSGLILLFERPINKGDWIVVGNTEGYVRRISIRSTQIQTFDRADVIVPNSELISGQVTNWMLRDTRGRARVPIGVAYGSDTQKVKELLLDVAHQHPLVVTDGSSPAPKVLFINFGDSSLNFELRCHVKNVDERLQVVSDLNFAIDAAFKQHAIEIPFPQRDVHIRSQEHKQEPPADK